MARWWESVPQLFDTAVFLDAHTIAAASVTCRFVQDHLRNPATLRWIADLRGITRAAGISCLEHLELAEAVADLECSIAFAYGETKLPKTAQPKVSRFANLMARLDKLTISIEAHCGLEAPSHSFATAFTRSRAEAVSRALVAEGIPQNRIHVKAWGFKRPLVWAFGEPLGAPNRRVELFISTGGFEVPDRRRPSDYAQPPADQADRRQQARVHLYEDLDANEAVLIPARLQGIFLQGAALLHVARPDGFQYDDDSEASWLSWGEEEDAAGAGSQGGETDEDGHE